MRKSFDGLCGIVTNQLGGDPLSDDVYVFAYRRRDRAKLLVWERTGFWLFYKRLEKTTLQLLPNPKQTPLVRNPLPTHLPRKEIVIEVKEDLTGLKKIGEENTEELECQTGQLYVNRYIRPKYALPEDKGVLT